MHVNTHDTMSTINHETQCMYTRRPNIRKATFSSIYKTYIHTHFPLADTNVQAHTLVHVSSYLGRLPACVRVRTRCTGQVYIVSTTQDQCSKQGNTTSTPTNGAISDVGHGVILTTSLEYGHITFVLPSGSLNHWLRWNTRHDGQWMRTRRPFPLPPVR